MSEVLLYVVQQTADRDWLVLHGPVGGEMTVLGRRPKKEAGKRLAQQHVGRRVLDWTWESEDRAYVAS